MDSDLLVLVLIAVTFASALNLWLTFRLSARIREMAAPAFTVPLGEPVPSFEGTAPAQSRTIRSSDLVGQPAVLVFLSPGCKACADRIAELVAILPGTEQLGVMLWIVPADDVHDIGRLVAGTPLAEHVLILDAANRLRLNPLRNAPFFLFIDEALIARASNTVGDEDWRAFVQQMREAGA
ncbi:MAG TPA: redoxin domain-containing protein [Allosphingosinicella sp.]|jgi:hypothetical protein